MSELSKDFAGAPTEWNDPVLLAGHLRHLVQHGNDPTPHFDRMKELMNGTPDEGLRVRCNQFLVLIERYLSALSAGTPAVVDLKREIERFDFEDSAVHPALLIDEGDV